MDHFAGRPWFKILYQRVEEWYQKRFGATVTESDEHVVSGVVMLFGTPVELLVPLTFTEVEKPGETFWLSLPDRVLPQENVLDWLSAQPSSENLPQGELEELVARATTVANNIRSIHRKLSDADYISQDAQRLAKTIDDNFYEAVRDILSFTEEERLTAIWELHMAMEKSFKVLLMQHRRQYPKIHPLRDLLSCASDLIDDAITPTLLDDFPSDREVIPARYAQGRPRTVEEVVRLYNLSLHVVKKCTDLLSQRLNISHARFLIRKAPWRT